MTDLDKMIGGVVTLGGMAIMADIMVGATKHITGEITGMTKDHYHVKLHKGGKIPGHRTPKKKGDVVKVHKSKVKIREVRKVRRY
jgi:hypothetical protein